MRPRSVSSLLVFMAAITANGQQGFHNDSGAPLGLVRITGDSGQHVATLYVMPGETMVIDAKGRPISGAGYYEAVPDAPGAYFRVGTDSERYGAFPSPITFDGKLDFPTLRVDKIAWDKNGSLTGITGLRPALESTVDIPITSDVKNPKVTDGDLYIALDGRDREGRAHKGTYRVRIKFGHIVAIEHGGMSLGQTVSVSVAALLVGFGVVAFVWRRRLARGSPHPAET